MISFHEAAKQVDRALVINPKQAYLLDLFKKSGVDAPRINDDHIRIYIPRKDWGVFRDDRFSKKIQFEDYDKWEREFLDHPNAVTAHDIRENQESYIYRCDFFELKELIDIKPDDGSCYIRSLCEPFDVEMELDFKKAENWLKHFNLFPYAQVHASGHLCYDEIKEVIETVQPRTVIPIHTEHPDVFKNIHDNVIIAEKNQQLLL